MGLSDVGWVAIAVGAWTAASAVINATQILNERRDTILVGYLKDQELTHEHRELIFYHDWLPTFVAIGGVCVAGSLMVVVLSWVLIESRPHAAAVSLFGVFMLLIVLKSYALGGRDEYHFIKRVLDTDPKKPNLSVPPSTQISSSASSN